MRLLLDTHILLWAAGFSGRLPEATQRLLEDGANDVFFSAASIWEIAIKSTMRRKDFDLDPATLLEVFARMDFVELPVASAHAAEVTRLPLHHKDPFDRLLVAQARVEPMVLLTSDRLLLRYSDNVRFVG